MIFFNATTQEYYYHIGLYSERMLIESVMMNRKLKYTSPSKLEQDFFGLFKYYQSLFHILTHHRIFLLRNQSLTLCGKGNPKKYYQLKKKSRLRKNCLFTLTRKNAFGKN